MKKISLLMVLCCTMIVVANTSYEPQAFDTIVVGQDTLLAPRHPEPIHLDLRPVRKATAACPLDSVVGLDANQNYSSKIEYEYDEQGHTIIETRYQWVNGVKTGVSKYWKKYTGNTATTTVNYKWDATNNSWIGKDSTQYKFMNWNNQLLQTDDERYLWENGKWRPNIIYHYEYSDKWGQLVLSLFRVWKSNIGESGALQDSTRFLYKYDDKGRQVEYSFCKYINGEWIGQDSTKIIYHSSGKKELEEKYKNWENGSWKGLSKYTYIYDDNAYPLEYIIYSWTNSSWVGITKDTYVYNTAHQTTEHISYIWNNNWVGKTKEIHTYSETGLLKEEATYEWLNDSWYGKQRTTYSYETGTQLPTEVITYGWNTNWVEQSKIVTIYNGAKITDQQKYTWVNEKWYGLSRIKCTWWNDGRDKDSITYVWNEENNLWNYKDSVEYSYPDSKTSIRVQYTWNDAWVGISKMVTNFYSGTLIANRINYVWFEGDWAGSVKEEITYNSKNQPLSEKVSIWYLTDWQNYSITTYKYNDAYSKTLALKVNANWDAEKSEWIATDSIKHVEFYETIADKQLVTLEADSTWTSTNGWSGNSKTEYQYNNETGRLTQKNTYKSNTKGWYNVEQWRYQYWQNTNLQTLYENMKWTGGKWVGSSKIEKGYDESNRQIMTANYKWNSSKAVWEGVTKSEDIYENGKKIGSISYGWDNSTVWDWYYKTKTIETAHDAYGHVIEKISSTYNRTSNTWQEQQKWAYEFDNKHSEAVRSDVYVWNTDDEDWCFQSKNEISYDDDADGKLRYQLDAAYTNCVLSTYDLKRYYYRCDPKQLTIIFNNWDGSQLTTFKAEEGITPAYPIDLDTPAKGGDAQYSYTFKGWDKDLVPVTGDATYTAVFEQNVNSYTINFVNEDNSPLQSTDVAYGTTPEYTGTTPAKGGDAQYSYTFKGWDKELVPVTGDATYTAVFEQSVNTYDVTFEVKGDASKSYTIEDVPYGALVNELAEQVKTLFGTTFEDDTYIYTFTGLENVTATDIVTENATFYVLYSAEPKKPTDIDHIEQSAGATKVMENGVLYIIRDGKRYHTTGTLAD